MAVQVGLSLTWSQTPKTDFLVTRLSLFLTLFAIPLHLFDAYMCGKITMFKVMENNSNLLGFQCVSDFSGKLCCSEDDEEETAAVTDPEGKPVKEKSDASKTTQQTDSKESQVLNTEYVCRKYQ